MIPTASMTLNEARDMKTRAIERAKALNIVEMVYFLLDTDPSTNGEDYVDKKNKGTEEYRFQRSRPLPGSGYILKGTLTGKQQHKLIVCLASNTTEIVFDFQKDYHKESYRTFREGSWVQVLQGNYEALRYRLENTDLINLSSNFSPIE